MNCTVSAFEVSTPGGRLQTRWRYELEPTESGTILTERFEVLWYKPVIIRLFFGGPQRRLAQLEDSVRRTLDRIKAAAEIL